MIAPHNKTVVMSALLRSVVILERATRWLVCSIFGVMLLVGALQILNRYLFGTSLSWSEELQRYLHVWLVFLSIPLAYRAGRHIGLNLLRERFSTAINTGLEVLIDALWLLVFCGMAVFTVQLMVVAKFQVTPGLGLRMDMVYAGILLGSVIQVYFAAGQLMGRLHEGAESKP